MFNFLIDKMIIVAGLAIAAFIVRDGRELVAVLVALLVISLITLKSYQEYLLIYHIKVKHNTFYKKYADQIGRKFWIGNLRKDLLDLDDGYIRNYIEHPIEINMTPPKSSDDANCDQNSGK